jgi:hypothetical protein
MIQIGFDRRLSQIIARSDVKPWEQGDSSRGWQDKSTDCRRAGCGWESGFFKTSLQATCRRFSRKARKFKMYCAVS